MLSKTYKLLLLLTGQPCSNRSSKNPPSHCSVRSMSSPIMPSPAVSALTIKLKAKFHYAIWFEAGRDRFEATSFEPASNQLA